MLLDRAEYLLDEDPIAYELEYFNSLSGALIYYYQRKRKAEISVK
jgi:hypothetical protein